MKKTLIIILLCSIVKVEAQSSAFSTIDSLLLKGRYKIALSQLKNIQPATFATNSKIGSIYESIDNNKNAIKYYTRAIGLKNDYATKVRLGKVYRKERLYKNAITIFEEIKQKDAKNLLAKYQLGRLYLLTSQPKKAKEVFQNLIKEDATNANYSYQLGLAYAQLKKRNLKINSFLDAYRKDDEHIKSIHQLAKSFTLLRDRDSASIFINKGLKVNPSHIALNKLKINSLYRKENYKKAIKLLENIDTLKPNDTYTQKMLGRSHYKLKEYDDAKKYFGKAKKIDRSDFKVYTYLGQIALEQEDYRKAQMNFMMATFAGKEARDEEYYGLGQVELALKRTKAAIRMFKKSYGENRSNYKALYQIATLSETFYKDKKIAYEHYQDFVNKFEKKDSLLTDYANKRIKVIKKYYFEKGVIID